MSEAARTRWNERWSRRGVVDALEREPSQWLVDNRKLLPAPPGAIALDVACGDGRNAAYLAWLGFSVDAVDVSDVAVEAVAAAARTRGLAVAAQRLDLERDPLPKGAYDVVIQFQYLQRDLFAALAEALTPGGVLVAQTFTTPSAGPDEPRMDPRFLLAPGELRTAFPGLDVLRYEEGVAGAGHRRRAVAGLVGRRPLRHGT